jgi:mannose-1-phosphate guanylyltransferase
MKAIILCAGIGKRLRPLTEHWPKPSIPVLGQPVFRFAVAELKRAGVTAVGINTHHRAEAMEAVASAECARAGLHLEIVREPIIQGTAGGIRGLRRLVEHDDFLVINGDVLFPLDLDRIQRAHRRAGAPATMILIRMPSGESYAPVEVDSSGRVRRIAGHGTGGEALQPWHFTGVHVLSPAVLNLISPHGPEDINRDVYPRMLAQGMPIHAEIVEGDWSELGTPERYLRTQLDILAGRALKELSPSPFSGAERKGHNQWRRSGARVKAAQIQGPAFFDENCEIEAGAVVGPEVYVGSRALVRKGSRLQCSVVLEDTEIDTGEHLVDVIAWGKHRLRAKPGRGK